MGIDSHGNNGHSHSHTGCFPFLPIPIPNFVTNSHSRGNSIGFPFPLGIPFPWSSLLQSMSLFKAVDVFCFPVPEWGWDCGEVVQTRSVWEWRSAQHYSASAAQPELRCRHSEQNDQSWNVASTGRHSRYVADNEIFSLVSMRILFASVVQERYSKKIFVLFPEKLLLTRRLSVYICTASYG